MHLCVQLYHTDKKYSWIWGKLNSTEQESIFFLIVKDNPKSHTENPYPNKYLINSKLFRSSK